MKPFKQLFFTVLLSFAVLFSFVTITGCENPFAPKVVSSDRNTGSIISDRKTIEGVFQNLSVAYQLKDTTIYGELLDPGFIFSYRDYDLGYDVTWGRSEEMRITQGLFKNSERLDLLFNNIVLISEDSVSAVVVRSFNLNITFNPTDIIRVDGKVNLQLQKDSSSGKWTISRWIDDSNY